MTGSPRVDLWNPTFHDYWNKPKTTSKKTFFANFIQYGFN